MTMTTWWSSGSSLWLQRPRLGWRRRAVRTDAEEIVLDDALLMIVVLHLHEYFSACPTSILQRRAVYVCFCPKFGSPCCSSRRSCKISHWMYLARLTPCTADDSDSHKVCERPTEDYRSICPGTDVVHKKCIIWECKKRENLGSLTERYSIMLSTLYILKMK